MLAALSLLVGDTDREQEAQFPLASLLHHVFRPIRNRHLQFLGHPLSATDNWNNDRCSVSKLSDRGLVVKAAINENSEDSEWQATTGSSASSIVSLAASSPRTQ